MEFTINNVAIGSPSTAVVERQMDRLALGLLSAGHFSVDLSQGAVPAMLPFFIRERHLSYVAAAGLVLAQTISSSILQPLFGGLTDRRSASWLMPAGVAVAAAGLVAAALLPTYGFIWLAIGLARQTTPRRAALLFHCSLLYLALIFLFAALDVVV